MIDNELRDTEYGVFQGCRLLVPKEAGNRPSPDALQWRVGDRKQNPWTGQI